MISFNSDFVLLPFRKGGGIMGEGTKILGILIISAIIFFGKDNITSDKGGKGKGGSGGGTGGGGAA